MREKKRAAAASVLTTCAVCASVLVQSSIPAWAQARGVIIQIPDDVMPGAPRPAPPPAPAPPPSTALPPSAPGAPGPDGGGAAACAGSACGKDAWHVVNTTNRTCLALSKHDVRDGKDVRRLASLLPPPRFVVAPGVCP